MAVFATDAFGAPSTVALTTHNAAWVQHSASTALSLASSIGRCRGEASAGNSLYYHTGSAASADYSVQCDLVFVTSNDENNGPCGRMDTSAQTFYHFRYAQVTGRWELYKFVAGTATLLDSLTETFSSGTKLVKLEMIGTAIKGYVDGVQKCSATDSSISAAGKAGIRNSKSSGTRADSTGLHIDNFEAADAAAGSAISFGGPIAAQNAQVGSAFSVDLSSNWSGSLTPFSYAVQTGSLPSGLSLNTSTGVISGTPTVAGVFSGVVIRGTDTGTNTADSNSFAFDVIPATLWTETEPVTNETNIGPYRGAHMTPGRLFFGTVRQSDHACRLYKLEESTLTGVTLTTFGGSADNHNSPSVYVDSSGFVYASAVAHGATSDILTYKSDAAYGTAFSSLTSVPSGSQEIRYPQLFKFAGRLFLLCNRGANRDVAFNVSDDDGVTWNGWTTVFQSDGAGIRPYFSAAEVDGELVMLVSRDHALDQAIGDNDGFFLRYDGTNWKSASGSNYTLPVTSTTADMCFDAGVASANFGFAPICLKDGSGRFVAMVEVYTSTTVRQVEMIRFASGSWSRARLTHPIATEMASPRINWGDPYRFVALGNYAGVWQWCIVNSDDDGATWDYTRVTTGALTRGRGAGRQIFGSPPADQPVVYRDASVTNNTTWTSDIHLPFSSAGSLPSAPTLSDLQAVNITASSVQGTYDYAF